VSLATRLAALATAVADRFARTPSKVSAKYAVLAHPNSPPSGTDNFSDDGALQTVAPGDRVLVLDHGQYSGLWTVAAGAWARVKDAQDSVELTGATVHVETGRFAGTQWVSTGDQNSYSGPWRQVALTPPRTDTMERAPARAATTANISLSGLQTVDGVALAAGDRVLVKNQTDSTFDGIYVAAAGAWSRAADANDKYKLHQGLTVYVASGTRHGQQTWRLVSNMSGGLPTSSQVWQSTALESMRVGFIYQTSDNVSPAALFGGSWSPIQDRMLIAVGGNTRWDTALETGGSETVLLTAAQSGLPAHAHRERAITSAFAPGGGGALAGLSLQGSPAANGPADQFTDSNTAADASQAHDNMPPFVAVYMWRRTA
jgi:hypothetical protein